MRSHSPGSSREAQLLWTAKPPVQVQSLSGAFVGEGQSDGSAKGSLIIGDLQCTHVYTLISVPFIQVLLCTYFMMLHQAPLTQINLCHRPVPIQYGVTFT